MNVHKITECFKKMNLRICALYLINLLFFKNPFKNSTVGGGGGTAGHKSRMNAS